MDSGTLILFAYGDSGQMRNKHSRLSIRFRGSLRLFEVAETNSRVSNQKFEISVAFG